MAKLHKVELYIVDANEYYENVDEIISYISDRIDLSLHHFNISSYEFEWDDDVPVNYGDCTKEDIEKFIENIEQII